MITSVRFENFKALRDTRLPLSRFTLIVGPNGSGKSTALQALQAISNPGQVNFRNVVTVGLQTNEQASVAVIVNWEGPSSRGKTEVRWFRERVVGPAHSDLTSQSFAQYLNKVLAKIRVYSLDARAIASPVQIQPEMQLSSNGANLAGVLDQLRDQAPERFEALNQELGRWMPEFDRILFDTTGTGSKAISLRTGEGHHKIPAADLSQGTLLALAMLTLAYIPDSAPIVCLEEPDRGIHPRLLRDVRDALYRLSYPESVGERRDPVQVIATTHSPYLLDLFRDHPEEIVIAQKEAQNVRFERLSDRPDLDEILQDAHLGEVWYSGILGGVPSHP